MKKIILILLLFMLTLPVSAKKYTRDFSTVINDSGVDIESIAISIKDTSNGKAVYELNEKMLMNPASVQKLLTTPVIVETLGEDYSFNTELYLREDNSYLLKLAGDPYLTSSDLKKLIGEVSKDTESFYIDDRILDKKTWGEGWQWDDDLNVLMPRFGAYNLDKNLIKLTLIPEPNGQFAKIINPSKYPMAFFNNVVTSDKTDISLSRDNSISPNTLMLSGTIARPTTVYIPNVNIKRYFEVQLTRLFEDRGIYMKNPYMPSVKKSGDVLKNHISHDIKFAINDILKNSNNLVSETLFKLAGAKYCNLETGTDVSGIKMFNDYCVNNKLDNSRIKITDASGVSKNNLVSADFITDFLVLNKSNKVLESLPAPGEGTLTHRMLTIKDNLKAKTGTLSDISSIAGYVTSKSGKKYAFSIMINDLNLSESDKKMLEDFIIREAYLRL